VFRANIDDKTLSVDLHGLQGLNFVMRDRQTGTLWQQATGVAFEGPLKGKRLTMVDFLLTTWDEWRKLHPETLALMPDPHYQDRYRGQGPRSGFPPVAPASRGKKLRDDPRLPEREQIVGIEMRDGQKAYPIALLRRQTVVNDRVGASPVVLVRSTNDTITAFSRNVRGLTLTFQAPQSGASELTDKETGSRWTAYGECISGQLKGAKLGKITPLPSFWFSWAQFFPQTEIFSVK
jgi:hypothetical protein